MKLAVSSIGWEPGLDDVVRALLVRRNIGAVELTPLKYWPRVDAVDAAGVADTRAQWEGDGIVICALQGILFGLPQLQLFGTPEQRSALERHLVSTMRLAGALGAKVVVLGAPKNRLRGALSEEDAVAEAAPLLRRVAAVAVDYDAALCIEPNPPRYGGDFVRTSGEAMALVAAVDHPGFGLHLDAGALAIADEADDQIVRAARVARHFHVSEVDLVPIGDGTVDHARIAAVVQRGGYNGWCSIEMAPVASGDVVGTIDRAIDAARTAYEQAVPTILLLP